MKHREPRVLALQKLLHHDNKKDSLTLSSFVDLRRMLNRLGTVRSAYNQCVGLGKLQGVK